MTMIKVSDNEEGQDGPDDQLAFGKRFTVFFSAAGTGLDLCGKEFARCDNNFLQ